MLLFLACGSVAPLGVDGAGGAEGAADVDAGDAGAAGAAGGAAAGAGGAGGADVDAGAAGAAGAGASGTGGAACVPAAVDGVACDCGGSCGPCPMTPGQSCGDNRRRSCTINGLPYLGCAACNVGDCVVRCVPGC